MVGLQPFARHDRGLAEYDRDLETLETLAVAAAEDFLKMAQSAKVGLAIACKDEWPKEVEHFERPDP